MMIVLSSLLVCITVAYAILIGLLLIGFSNLEEPPGNEPGGPMFISVVIAFRNEESHLPGLLKSLENQTYPDTHFEVIFVDDHSEDQSARIVSEACKGRKRTMLLALGPESSGKKAARAMGVRHAHAGIIIQTDADVILGEGFIEAHAGMHRSSGADLVAGPVTIGFQGRSFFSALETLDLLSLTGTGAGSYYYDNPLMCSGANLSYKTTLLKEAELHMEGSRSPSGDDMFLLIAAKKLQKKIRYVKSEQALVHTSPAGSIRAFIRQRIRWGSKAKYYTDRDIIWMSLQVAITNLALLLSCLLPVFNASFLPVVLGCLVLKSAADFSLLITVSRFTGQASLMWYFPVVSVLYYAYLPMLVLASVLGRVRWKDRTY